MEEKEYSRAQINAALWRVFAPFDHNVKSINRVFKSRIKKLIECDTAARISIETKKRPAVSCSHVFSPGPSEPGQATKYEALDACCLAIAIELTDMGTKQSEALEFVRLARPSIKEYLRIKWTLLAYSAIDPKKPILDSANYPRLPTAERPDRSGRGSDVRTYMIFKKAELNEINFEFDEKNRSNDKPAKSTYLPPIVCKGIEELAAEINRFSLKDMRSFLVVEIGYLIQRTTSQLEMTGRIGRGRPDTEF